MPYKIIKADIMAWLEEYQGEPFHAALFDPPYHLTSIVERFNKDEPEHTKTAKDIANRSTPIARLAKGFMGKNWDGGDLIFQAETWQLLSTVLHPGAFVMAYCSSRGWHRQAVAMEDGGMIFHPSIFMFGMGFGSGFPKATRIDTQIDAMAGEEREVVGKEIITGQALGQTKGFKGTYDGKQEYKTEFNITKPATPLAESWQGHRYGLQLIKPSLEPILVGQKPYQGKPVENIVKTGAGAINVDGGRVGTDGATMAEHIKNPGISTFGDGLNGGGKIQLNKGRWPSSLILHHLPECKRVGTKKVRGAVVGDTTKSVQTRKIYNKYGQIQQKGFTHADSDGYETVTEWQCHEKCPIRIIGEQSGESKSAPTKWKGFSGSGSHEGWVRKSHTLEIETCYNDSGTAARYFYQPDWSYEIYEQLNNADLLQYITKPSTTEREAGLEKLPFGTRNRVNSGGYEKDEKWRPVERKNTHPTVKSIALNKYLATLLLPPPEYAPRRILVPFCGSGSEVIGCLLAGWDEVTGIELEQEYYDIASERVAWWYGVMESCNYDVDNIIEHWQEEQKLKESGQMRLL